jgi:outer membrane protein assembly factor BamB
MAENGASGIAGEKPGLVRHWLRASGWGQRRFLTAGVVLSVLAAVLSGLFGLLQVRNGALLAELGARSTGPAQAPLAPKATSSPRPIVAALPAGNDWTQYRFDTAGSGVNPERQLTTANVATLAPRWSVDTKTAFESTPAIVDGVVYVTDGNSLLAFDLRTGAQRWHFDALPQQIATVSSSVAVDPALHLAFYGNPDARLYAVDTRTGKGVWKAQLSTEPGAFIWSSPLLVNGKLYIGVASHDDNPCVRGAVFELDEREGTILWSHYTVPADQLGGAVWSSLTANTSLRELFVTTGNPCPDGGAVAEEDSFLGLDWETGNTRWQYQAISYDTCDCDFGEGAVDAIYQNREYIVGGNKHGDIYGLSRDPAGGPPQLTWSTRITDAGFLGEGGIFEPPTYSDGLVFVAGGPTLDGACQNGALYALHVDMGQTAWRVCTSGQVVSPAALTGGVLFVAQQDALVAYEATTGRALATFAQSGAHWGGVAIAHGFVVNGSVPGTLYGYALPTPRA